MRAQPDPAADPYRTLGLDPGASMAEVKRAYRLLAKAFHPDSAGEAALPRFLAIHAAYEQLKTGRVPAGRVPAAGRASNAAPAPTAEPWRADPARARAARERARTGKTSASSGAAGGAAGTGGATGGARSQNGSAGGSAGSGSAGTGASSTRSSSTGGSTRAGRRATRKATMGSTSYDEARDPADASWSGASWYGPSSGEYWIVNPREYADPRKHGPDYQQRARRLAESESIDPIAEPAAATASTVGVDAEAAGESPAATATDDTYKSAWAAASARPTAWTTSAGARLPGDAARESTDAARATSGDAPPIDRIEAASRAWLGGPADDPIRRLGLALIAWPPLGIAAATAIGEATGCSVFSAECVGPEPLLPWLAQAVILGLLLLLPPITRVLAGGSIAVLLALVPITAFLIAVGGGNAPQAGPVLGFLLGVVWLLGGTWSAWVLLTRGRAQVVT